MKPLWDWKDVGVHWRIVEKLLIAGIVRAFGGRRKSYLLVDREGIMKEIEEYESIQQVDESVTEKVESGVPPDVFDVIEGYDDLKSFMLKIVTLDEPFHVLLVGPPGTAKTLFLMEIERLPNTKFITAGTSSKVGIRDMLIEEKPRILLIDELEKIDDPKDLSVLLTLMESQRIIVTKHKTHAVEKFPCSVIAACNRIDKLPRELLDRFQVFHLKEYTKDEFLKITTNYLAKRRGMDAELARYIAEKVSEYSKSVREAIRTSKVAKTKEDVDRMINLFKKYSSQ
ncbi:MAG: AAA family ATPase [Candidatus Jordarchaeales archaeon]